MDKLYTVKYNCIFLLKQTRDAHLQEEIFIGLILLVVHPTISTATGGGVVNRDAG